MASKSEKKMWYQFHLERYQRKQKQNVDANYGSSIKTKEETYNRAEQFLQKVKNQEPITSKLQYLLGLESGYRETKIKPFEEKVAIAWSDLYVAREKYRKLINQAEEKGAKLYECRRSDIRQETEERKERISHRKEERRLRYLENSPAIRSNQKKIKIQKIKKQSNSGYIECCYCHKKIPSNSTELELEHKKPVSRGGTNSRKNTALSCKECNRRKGNKTVKEYAKYLKDKGEHIPFDETKFSLTTCLVSHSDKKT